MCLVPLSPDVLQIRSLYDLHQINVFFIVIENTQHDIRPLNKCLRVQYSAVNRQRLSTTFYLFFLTVANSRYSSLL